MTLSRDFRRVIFFYCMKRFPSRRISNLICLEHGHDIGIVNRHPIVFQGVLLEQIQFHVETYTDPLRVLKIDRNLSVCLPIFQSTVIPTKSATQYGVVFKSVLQCKSF